MGGRPVRGVAKNPLKNVEDITNVKMGNGGGVRVLGCGDSTYMV